MALHLESDGRVGAAADRELWRHPDPGSTQMYRFLEHVNAKYALRLRDYPALHRWSVDNVSAFWEETWHFVGIKASRPYDEVGHSP